MRIFDNPYYYKILEVDETASQKEISAAFRRLSKEYHPDRIPDHLLRIKQEAQEKLKQINEAYQVLSDPEKRMQYDVWLEGLREEEIEGASESHVSDYGEAQSTEEEAIAPRSSKKKKIILYGITGLVFLIGVVVWVLIRDRSGISFGIGTTLFAAGLIGAMVGFINTLIKEKLS